MIVVAGVVLSLPRVLGRTGATVGDISECTGPTSAIAGVVVIRQSTDGTSYRFKCAWIPFGNRRGNIDWLSLATCEVAGLLQMQTSDKDV